MTMPARGQAGLLLDEAQTVISPTIAFLLVSPLAAAAPSHWAELSPKDNGFSIQMPGTPKPDPKKPGRFSVREGRSFTAESERLEGAMHSVAESGNKR